jgi:hypothetical protein
MSAHQNRRCLLCRNPLLFYETQCSACGQKAQPVASPGLDSGTPKQPCDCAARLAPGLHETWCREG